MALSSHRGQEGRAGQSQQALLAKEIAERLVIWFEVEGRRFPWRARRLEGWKLLLTEMLLQQTQAARVSTFLEGFFDKYPSLETIANEDENQLAAVLAPLGLQNRRASRMRRLALALLESDGEIPRARSDLLKLPGVGPYVANAYLSVAHGEALPSLDVNMARILERLFGPRQLVDIRYDPHLAATSDLVLRAADDPRIVNWAMLDLGALYCTARNPECGRCPLNSCCRTAQGTRRRVTDSGADPK